MLRHFKKHVHTTNVYICDSNSATFAVHLPVTMLLKC